ncbi:MAG: TonB-dependent receptor [Bacteroidetes bacterium]|nr:TonB-dependent receptor [Bacteroidota bacterium]
MKHAVWFFIGWCLSLSSFAQNLATVKGIVQQSNTREAIPFASISIKEKSIGTTSDNNGFFSITKLPAGKYTLIISAIGFETWSQEIQLNPDQILQVRPMLGNKTMVIKGFNYTADRIQEKRENTGVSVIKISPEEMKRMPSYGGEADVAQMMQIIPGVITTGDQGGQLFIRGGPPVQNKMLMDGAVIYNPFHSIGFFSVFDTDVLSNMDVYAGGFSAEYGGRISSIMDLSTRDGNRTRLSGRANINTFTGKLMLEGPMGRLKDGAANATFLLSGKGSFLKQSSQVFYPYADSIGLPFNFFDGYGKMTLYVGNNGSKLNFFGFSHNDWVTFNETSDLQWKSGGGGANFFIIPGEANVNIDGVFSYSNYEIGLTESVTQPRSSSINGFNFNVNFHQYYGTNRLTYGVEASGFQTNFDYVNGQFREIQQQDNTTEFAAFTRYKFMVGRFIFDPSFRIHYYASMSEVSPEPRLSIKYNISEHFRLKMAGGWYSQNLIAANSDRDVVNLFYGFLSAGGSIGLSDNFQGEQLQSDLQKARHAIFGAEFELFKNIEFNVEGYYMDFFQLISMNRDKLYEDTPGNSAIPDYQKKDLIRETGWSAGLDVLVKAEIKNLYLWVGYSLMALERSDDVRDYVPHFDRRHNMNVVASYQFGKNKQWEINARWNFGTGFPFTQTQGFYENVGFDGNINGDYTSQNGELGVELGQLNLGRLPNYHRLDINIKRRFNLGENTKLEANIGATNVYNRNNIFYVDRITFNRVDQLPIIPTVGLNFAF